ncbi:hypothetical protein HanRHA438_Chr09g0382911 [Helianthus annuus]|nr:hypothetical protein HanIR_Chr09g0400561 [Helianthus annuus]KAJ0886738.1 hypothetical protein HanRHA438_Chr09g0382911 [Helianthus annuus]
MDRFVKGTKKKRTASHAIILAGLWCIWVMRNKVVSNQKQTARGMVIEETKALSFMWVHNRSKDFSITCNRWRRFEVFEGYRWFFFFDFLLVIVVFGSSCLVVFVLFSLLLALWLK